jgi:preprotein translocase subunit SecD
VKTLAILVLVVACKGSDDPKRPHDGLEIVYSIDLDRAVADRADEIKRDLESRFAEDRIPATVTVGITGNVTVNLRDGGRRGDIEAALKSDYGDSIAMQTCDPPTGADAICLRVSAGVADAIKKRALQNAVDTIRRRIDGIKLDAPAVNARGDQIVVELPALEPEAISTIKDLIARTGRLEMKVVDDGSDYMKKLAARVPGDPDAQAVEIRAEVESWTSVDGVLHVDRYLTAHDRAKLSGAQLIRRYLAALAAKDPAFVIPNDREIGFEFIESGTGSRLVGAIPGVRPMWRTYYLERAAALSGAAISDASASFEPTTHRPIVLLELDRHGTRVFADLTARIVGKKLATVLDGWIKTAPIINGAIGGGRASITMGGDDPQRMQRAATELAEVLKSGALPAPLREETVSPASLNRSPK